MASTYSPYLRLELIGTGEQTGTWGATTNTNLGTLLDQAVAGTATIDVTLGDVTLTALNGSSDQSRQAILKITGTPIAARNVIAPESSKWYLVSNDCGQTITLKGSTTSGYAIADGETLLMFWNGTDFVPGSSTALGYTPVNKAGDTMTGALYLPAATPTLSTQAANKAYVDAAVSGAVGSNFVLKTGDTMTGPLVLPGAPTLSTQAATKGYVDGAISGAGFATQSWVTSQNYANTSTQSMLYYYTKTDSDSRYVSVNTQSLTYYPLTTVVAATYGAKSGSNTWTGANSFTTSTAFAGLTSSGGIVASYAGGTTSLISNGVLLGGSNTSIAGDGSAQIALAVGGVNKQQIFSTEVSFSVPTKVNTYGSAFKGGTGGALANLAVYMSGQREAQLGLYYSDTAGGGWRIGQTTNSTGAFVVYPNDNSIGGAFIDYTSTSWNARSDRRIKKDLVVIPNALDKLDKINGYTGKFIGDEDNKSRSFLVAQELQDVLPEAVCIAPRRDTDGDGVPEDVLGLAYTDVIPLLVQAIKELKAEVAELKAAK